MRGASNPMPMEIRLFGAREFTHGGQLWRFTAPPRTIALLAYLVMARGPVRRDLLAAMLWPETDEETARANLRRHLHHLQKALPASAIPWITVDAAGVRWSGDAWIDAPAFEHLHEAGERAQAVACYTGEFLTGIYDDWVVAHRERLASAYLDDLAALLADARSRLDHATAVLYAQAILEHDEWREDIVRALMTIRYESGDRAGALAAYERFAKRLREEMRVDPMPETQALRAAIAQNAPVTLAAPSNGAKAGSRGTPFVGRTRELTMLRERLHEADRSRGTLVFISGEPGIGKTRIARELALEMEREGGRVFTGGTSRPEATPYEPLVDVLRSASSLIAESALEARLRDVVGSIVPELGGARGAQDRSRLFEAIAQALTELTRSRPLLLVLEDTHWASEATLAAIEYLAHRLPSSAATVLVTYREGDDHPPAVERLRRLLEREGRCSHVRLGRLRHEDVASLIEATPGFESTPQHEIGVYHRLSNGNPLFLLQLMQDRIERGLPAVEAAATESVQTAIAARIARLPARARSLAEHAAVAGRSFSVDLLRDATGWDEDHVLEALSDLIDRRIVKSSSERSRYDYAFAHHLLQAGVYNEIPEKERARLHRRMVRLYERLIEDHPSLASELAMHYERSGDPTIAAAAYLRAAEHALGVHANSSARELALRAAALDPRDGFRYLAYRAAVIADERLGDGDAWDADVRMLLALSGSRREAERFEALERLVRRLNVCGDREAQRNAIEEMASLAESAGDNRQRAAVAIARSAMMQGQGESSSALAELRRAIEFSQRAADDALLFDARISLVTALLYTGATEDAELELRALRARAPRNDDDLLAIARLDALLALCREDGAALESAAREQERLALRVGDAEAQASAQRLLGYAVAFGGLDLESMREAFAQSARTFERIGATRSHAAALCDLGSVEAELGRYDAAGALLDRVEEIAARIEWKSGLAYAKLVRAKTAHARGDLDDARRLAEEAMTLAESTTETKVRCTALTLLGSIDCALGDHALGLHRLREGISMRRAIGADWSMTEDLCLIIEGLLAARDVGAAQDAARELEELFELRSGRHMYPERICWTLARVRREAGDGAGYWRFVERGRSAVEERCARLRDESLREALLAQPASRGLILAERP